ncbi:MAG TPA: hypothetical protein VGG35_25405 [Streptosporangiaceae bacterium]|jgi:hypothetical protein
MAAIGVLVVVAALGIGLAALLAVVIIGVHQEEKQWTLGCPAPSMPARLTRRVLGASYPASQPLTSVSAAMRDDLPVDTYAGS